MMCVSASNEASMSGFISAQQDGAYVKTTETLFVQRTLAVPTSSLTFCHRPSDESRLCQFPSARDYGSALMTVDITSHRSSNFTKMRNVHGKPGVSTQQTPKGFDRDDSKYATGNKFIACQRSWTTSGTSVIRSRDSNDRFVSKYRSARAASTARVSERRDSKGSRDSSRSPRQGDSRFKKRH